MPSPTLRPTLEAIQQHVGEVSSALFALRDMGVDLGDHDTCAYRFSVLAGIFAKRLDDTYVMLDPHVWDETPPTDPPPGQEGQDGD